jgi:hypothetical protein
VSAGIALDEWIPPKLPKNEEWLAAGLRTGRKTNPDIFIAVWSTDPTPPLIEMVKDGTVDLVIVEGYTHSVLRDESMRWASALRRTDLFAKAEVMDRTIFSFGHITPELSHRKERLTGPELRRQMEELKKRYPAMPGVGFFQSAVPDSPELRELVRICDRLSGEFWPS